MKNLQSETTEADLPDHFDVKLALRQGETWHTVGLVRETWQYERCQADFSGCLYR